MSKHSITRSRRGSLLPSFRGGQRGCGCYDFLGEHTLRYCSTYTNSGLWGKVDGDAAGMALSLMIRSSYGAVLLSWLQPRSYVGIDLMPEMIELAKQRSLPNATFLVMDASDLSHFPDDSQDLEVIFGILHHIPAWRKVLDECQRVLRAEGRMFLEEPAAWAIRIWDFFFRWNHPREALFGRAELEDQLRLSGFSLAGRIGVPGFWSYCVRKNT